MTTSTWPCGAPKSTNNAFTGAGLPAQTKPRAISMKVSLAPRHDSLPIFKTDTVKRAKLLNGSL